MRPTESLASVAAVVFAAFFAVACVMMGVGSSEASEPDAISTRPSRLPDLRSYLDEGDEIATLDAIHFALTQVGDGATYVWHRHNGRISAIVYMNKSFKDRAGHVCRQVEVTFASGVISKKTEAVACRQLSGRWQLDG